MELLAVQVGPALLLLLSIKVHAVSCTSLPAFSSAPYRPMWEPALDPGLRPFGRQLHQRTSDREQEGVDSLRDLGSRASAFGATALASLGDDGLQVVGATVCL